MSQDVVKWSIKSNRISEKVFEIRLKAVIDPLWHIYSLTTPKGGPTPTRVVINKNPLVSIVGSVNEIGKVIGKYEDAFGVDVRYFEKTVELVQTVKLKGNFQTNVSGWISFMACNDEKCLPLKTEKFSIKLQ